MSYENSMNFDMEMTGAVLVNGKDGVSPVVEMTKEGDKTTLAITDANGTSTTEILDGKPGERGAAGEDGKTPVKGVDYWTDDEKKEIVDEVVDSVSHPVRGSVGDYSLVGNVVDSNKASGRASVALNFTNTASGNNAVATGTTTTASGAAAFSANCGTQASGDISAAFGNNTKASTTYAFASGDASEANGVASFASNYNNKANGKYSFATGSTNTVSGEASSAFGLMNEVPGKYSSAFGQQNAVTGNYSNAQGYNQKNRGHFASTFGHSTETYDGSLNQAAFGTFNKASYDSLFMIGVGTSDTARKNAFEVKSNGTVMIGNAPLTEEKVNSIGTSTGITDAEKQEIIDEVLEQIPDAPEPLVKAGMGTNSTISNNFEQNRANGAYSHAEGSITYASGDYSHAEGQNSSARGAYSHAEGRTTETIGECSHAEGCLTQANGDYSHAEGRGCFTYGDCSHAEGYGSNTTSTALYAHAEGCGTYACSACQHVQGMYNVLDNANQFAHIVGNGESESTRSNAHTLDWNGLGWFAGGLKVGGAGQDDENAVDILAYIQALEERIKALEG